MFLGEGDTDFHIAAAERFWGRRSTRVAPEWHTRMLTWHHYNAIMLP